MRPPKAVVNAVRNLLLIATLAATTGRAGQSDQDESFLCSWYAYSWNLTVVINGRSKDYRQETMKYTLSAFTALLLTPLAALMNCQRLETIRRESSKPGN